MEELKICPFCGAKSELIDDNTPETHYKSVHCTGCGACSAWDSKVRTIQAWNTRAPIEHSGESQPEQGEILSEKDCFEFVDLLTRDGEKDIEEGLKRAYSALRTQLTAAQERIKELEKERDEAIAHDRQPYPTAFAYEMVCKKMHELESQLATQRNEVLEEVKQKLRDGGIVGGSWLFEQIAALKSTIS